MHLAKHVCVIGGGIQSASTCYFLNKLNPALKITVLEASPVSIAPHASGKGGGFLARDWGSGVTTEFHHRSFALHEEIAAELQLTSYRKGLRVISVNPGTGNSNNFSSQRSFAEDDASEEALLAKAVEKTERERRERKGARAKDPSEVTPNYLDGNFGRASVMETESDMAAAQVHPREYTEKVMAASGAVVKLNANVQSVTMHNEAVTGVVYKDDQNAEFTIDCDTVVCCNGPWASKVEQWFACAGVNFPMQGIKSVSLCFDDKEEVDGVGIFTGEDDRFNTHLEIYPRPDGEIYICGVGGSDYVSKGELQADKNLYSCEPNEARVAKGTESFQNMSARFQGVAPTKTQACMRPCPADANPVVCAIPGVSGAYVNAGHNCWGILWSPASGQAIAELIVNGKSSYAIEPFDISRFGLTKSGGGGEKDGKRGRKKGDAPVGEQW